MDSIKRSRKGMEMTMNTLIIMVIGLVVIVIALYLLFGKSKILSSSSTCPESECSTSGDAGCQSLKAGTVAGFTACQKTNATTKKTVTGRCCVAE